jgi:hypothetical protein
MDTSIAFSSDYKVHNNPQGNPVLSLKTSHGTFESKEDTDFSLNSFQSKQ